MHASIVIPIHSRSNHKTQQDREESAYYAHHRLTGAVMQFKNLLPDQPIHGPLTQQGKADKSNNEKGGMTKGIHVEQNSNIALAFLATTANKEINMLHQRHPRQPMDNIQGQENARIEGYGGGLNSTFASALSYKR